MTDKITEAREKLIALREAEGNPYSEVVCRGIRSGQWDRGDLIRKIIKENAQTPLQGE